MSARSIFHLVRHAAHDRLGTVLVGRLNGVHLSLTGRSQARDLAEHFRREEIAAVLSSPRERAQETADPIATALGQTHRVSNALDEISLGGWQGHAVDALAADPHWQRWNGARSLTRPPRGETIAEVQARMLAELLHLHATAPGQYVLVSHAEPIRATLLHMLGISADRWNLIEIEPASITTLALDEGGGRILRMNMPVMARVSA